MRSSLSISLLFVLAVQFSCRPSPQTPAAEGPYAGKELTVALAPGRIEDFNRYIAPEFERQSGARLNPVGMRSSDQVARVRIEKDRPSLDVLWIDFGEAHLLGRESLLEKLTEDDIPNLRRIREEARSPLGIAPVTFSSALGFLYNTERIREPPRSWVDLWSPRFKGELALFDFGSSLGPVTLAVAARLFGGSEQDVEPGFRKLAELAASAVSFRTSGPGNNNLVAQGEAGVTFALPNQTRDLMAKGAPVAWIVPEEGAIALAQGFQIVSGAPEPELARAFLDYALSLETQTMFANQMLLVVTHRDVAVDPENEALVPLDRVIYLDFEAIGAQRGVWTDRFNREILGD